MIIQKVEVTSVEEIEQRLGAFKSKAPLVVSRAINRAVSNIRKNMGKEVPQRYFVSSGTVRGTIRTVNANKGSLSGAVISRGSPIALSKFKVSPNIFPRRVFGRRGEIRRAEAAFRRSEGFHC